MPWVEVFVVFVVCHLVGDFIVQTEWQAVHKRGGLGRSAVNRRALVTHVCTYTLSFVPAFIWLWSDVHGGVFGIAALIFIPHLIQDDGRVLAVYAKAVKKVELQDYPSLGLALDQTFHIVTLFLTALLVGN